MGGGTLTATREGDKIILADGAGGKATIVKADENSCQWRDPPDRCRADARRVHLKSPSGLTGLAGEPLGIPISPFRVANASL